MAISVQKILTKLFGSRNERLLKRYRGVVAQINALEPQIQAQTDEQLLARTQELRTGLKAGKLRSSDVMPEAFAIIREAMDRHIGIRAIFNPDENFNPDQLDDEHLELYDSVQRRMIQTGEPWTKVPIPHKLYAAVRKLHPESRPPFRARCFDVQLIGGLVLYEGKIAEMATGEGKTFVAPLACFMRVLEGMHCHVVTVNDYLVRRDATWVRPAFENLGMSVGFVQSEMEPGAETRRRMYECDVTYGTNSEFGFDYLRDNMKERVDLQVQGPLDFAIVDEVDSILIDEARTPLIISGAAHDDAPKYRDADRVARKIIELNRPWAAVEKEIDAAKRAIKAAEGDMDKYKKSDPEYAAAEKRREDAEKALAAAEGKKTGLTQFYEVELDRKSVHLTHEGIAAAQDEAGVGSFYVGNNMEWPHLMEQALRAHVVYERDKDYVVERGQRGEMEVVIVDEYTGRKMVGRQWSEGLHQAVEAKERVPIKQETQTLATITLQNFFKLYKALAGMTGTAQTEAEEFTKIYKLEVVTIPTNRPCIRSDQEDRVYRTEREKWTSIIEEIKRYSDAGRPVLVGTTSVEKSEMVSNLLKHRYGVEHEVLNAKQHEREATIVAKAGQQHKNAHGDMVGNVTIATNMAGRGTDIKLANETIFDIEPDPNNGDGAHLIAVQRVTGKRIPFENNTDSVFYTPSGSKTTGGLHVIGTERHTARRIDNQLRGRGGRQGDPGSSRFYVSLQDELMQMFAGEWTIKVLGWLGMEEGMAIEDKRISKGILRAQKKVEERNFLARKHLLEYDEVMDYQRSGFYGMRQKVLEGQNVDQIIWGMIGQSVEDAVGKYIEEDYVAACLVEWTRMNFDITLEPEDFRGLRTLEDLENYIKNQARTEVLHTVESTLGEFMGEDPEEREWDTRSLSSWAMSRFQVNLPQAQIRKMTPEQVGETLKAAAIEQVDKRDCAGIVRFLAPHYAEQELANWARDKFGISIDPMGFIADAERKVRKEPSEIVTLIVNQAREAYARRQIEYPIDHVLTFVYGGGENVTDNPYAADYVRGWAWMKFREELSLDEIRSMSVRRLRDRLIGMMEQYVEDGRLAKEVDTILQAHQEPAAVAAAVNERFGTNYTQDDVQVWSTPADVALSDG
ncbi:MAG: preprotein translocase subunit SecA, partial [Bacillota bacterium]